MSHPSLLNAYIFVHSGCHSFVVGLPLIGYSIASYCPHFVDYMSSNKESHWQITDYSISYKFNKLFEASREGGAMPFVSVPNTASNWVIVFLGFNFFWIFPFSSICIPSNVYLSKFYIISFVFQYSTYSKFYIFPHPHIIETISSFNTQLPWPTYHPNFSFPH